MSIPPVPRGLPNTRVAAVANRLHSVAIHVLRRARLEDRAVGLSAERLSVLSVLAFAGPRSIGELADIEMVSRPAVTRIAQSLEGLGLVRRQSDPSDGRRVVVRVTSRGRRVVEAGRRRRVARIAAELTSLDPAEVAALDRATRILASLDSREVRAPRS